MAPNKRGGPISEVILSPDEVAARGRGTVEDADSYDGSRAAELRVFFTGRRRPQSRVRTHALPHAPACAACGAFHVLAAASWQRQHALRPPQPLSAALMLI